MAQILYEDTARCTIKLLRGAEMLVNVMHVKAGSFDPADSVDYCDAFAKLYVNLSTASAPSRGINNFIDGSVTVYSATFQPINELPYPDSVETLYGTVGTAASGDLIPLSTALCVSLRTGASGPSNRGRLYIGGFNENANTEDDGNYPRPTAALLTAVQNAMVDLQDRLQVIAPTADLAVLSRTEVRSRNVTQIRTANIWSSQRRRQNKVPVTIAASVPIS